MPWPFEHAPDDLGPLREALQADMRTSPGPITFTPILYPRGGFTQEVHYVSGSGYNVDMAVPYSIVTFAGALSVQIVFVEAA